MNTYDKSSLVLIPSGIKDGKIYSQRPENGDGDFTFTRASAATRVNENGLIESVSSNTPRLDYSGGASCPSLLLEPQRTNVILYSEQINSNGLSEIGSSIDSDVTISPDGSVNADLLKENSSVGSHFAYKDFNLTNGSTYTISIFAKSNGENRNIRLGDGGLGWAIDFDSDFDLTLGTATNNGVIEDYGNGWYRCSVIGTTNATTSRLIIYSLLNTATNYQGDGTSGVYLYGFQIEEGSYATSYIPTSGSSVTRLNSAISVDTSSFGITNEFTLFIDTNGVQVEGTSLNAMDDLRWYSQSNNRYRFYKSSDFAYISNAILVDDRTKIALKVTETECKTFVDGVLNSTISLATPFSSFDAINKNSETKVKDSFNKIILFPTALTDEEAISLTTL